MFRECFVAAAVGGTVPTALAGSSDPASAAAA